MAGRLPTGRLPKEPGRPKISLLIALESTVLNGSVVRSVPEKVDWYVDVPAHVWGMDGNDGAGDCTFADVDHEIKADQNVAGNPFVRSTTAEVLAAYSAVTGYDPSRPDTDQGAVMQKVREWWRKTGITLGGELHKILLFAEVDHTNELLLKYGVAEFGAVGLGIEFPDSAMHQFDAGQPWDVVAGEPAPTSGHAIALVGYDPTWWYVVTWGRVQRVTPAFLAKYLDEAWIVLTADQVNARTGSNSQHVTMFELGQQFAQLTGKPNPVPAPTPPAGPPAVVTRTFPADVAAWLDRWAAHKSLPGFNATAAKANWKQGVSQ